MSAIRTSQKMGVPEWKKQKRLSVQRLIPFLPWFGLAGVVGFGQQEKHIIVA